MGGRRLAGWELCRQVLRSFGYGRKGGSLASARKGQRMDLAVGVIVEGAGQQFHCTDMEVRVQRWKTQVVGQHTYVGKWSRGMDHEALLSINREIAESLVGWQCKPAASIRNA